MGIKPIDALAAEVAALLPQLQDDLMRLVRIPSISAAGFPPAPLFEAHEVIVGMLRAAGVEQIEELRLEGKTAPVIKAELPGPPESPTVLLYTHYDVVAGGDESRWSSPPFEPVVRDGAVYGRGAADSKANLVALIGAVRAWGGKPPVTVRFMLEGQEEVGSPFDFLPAHSPEHFQADAIIVADAGNVRAGVPTMTIGLRGDAALVVEVRTLASDKHSGQYGGAAPDALLTLLHALATLHDANGDVAVTGLLREAWTGAIYTEEEFRTLAEIVGSTPLLGTGTLGERIWSGPAITVTGIDVPSVENAVAAVRSHARARLNIRVHPNQSAREAQDAVVRHLEAVHPFSVELTFHRGDVGDGYAPATDGPAYHAARAAMQAAWGNPTVFMATGGAIPLVSSMAKGVPNAELLLFGCTDSYANIHGPDERVLLSEFEKFTVALATFFSEYAAQWKRGN